MILLRINRVCDKFGLFMIVSFVSPGGPRRCRTVGFPAFRLLSRRGRGARPVNGTRPCTPHCQRHPHPPRRTRPLPSPIPSTRRSTPGAAVRVRPPAVAQGCGLVGRRVGRRIQVQMARCSPFPADRASPRHGPPSRLAARKLQVQLGANLEGRVEGVRLPEGPTQVRSRPKLRPARDELHLVEYGPSKTLRVSPVRFDGPHRAATGTLYGSHTVKIEFEK